jgi:hypothetical protein
LRVGSWSAGVGRQRFGADLTARQKHRAAKRAGPSRAEFPTTVQAAFAGAEQEEQRLKAGERRKIAVIQFAVGLWGEYRQLGKTNLSC